MLLSANTANGSCLNGAEAERVEVAKITDGDTVVLTDKRKVRIIGVNTAELNAKHPLSRSLAKQGRNAVQRWLANSSRIFLIEGKENQDRHGRALAHLRNEDKQLLSEFLITEGVAAATAVSPNTRCANYLSKPEGPAQTQATGVWHESNPWFITSNKLSKKSHGGFHIVQARVKKIIKYNRRTVITLDNGLHVNVSKKLYGDIRQELQPKNDIEVRGWISFKNNKPQLTLYHSTSLRVF